MLAGGGGGGEAASYSRKTAKRPQAMKNDNAYQSLWQKLSEKPDFC